MEKNGMATTTNKKMRKLTNGAMKMKPFRKHAGVWVREIQRRELM